MLAFHSSKPKGVIGSLLLFALLLPVAVADCTGEQSYVVTLKMSFTQNVDPSIPPAGDARVPLVVGVSHTSEYYLFRNTRDVDDASAEVASARRSDKIAEKLDELSRQGIVRSYYILEDVPIDDISQLQVTVQGKATFVSLMAPVTPSPAWFVGVDSYDVCQNGTQILKNPSIDVKTFRSGLEKGESFTGNRIPVEEGDALPVEAVNDFERIASMSIEQGELGVNWWKILLGVLVGVAVLIVLVIFVYPRFRRKRRMDVPLTNQEEIDW